MFSPIFISEGLRMYKRSIRVKRRGFKQYKGSAEQICKSIIEDCWNGRYFMTSTGHFCEFWTRDFSWCAEPLIKLGYKDKVKETIEYALGIFLKNNKITTTISPRGVAFDFPLFSPDSLPSIIYSMSLLKDKSLIKKYENFLDTEIKKYEKKVFDKDSGLVKQGVPFSSIKDHARRSSSCYNNVIVAMLANELKKTNLYNPFKKYNFKKIIKKEFWNGSYFYDDLNKLQIVTGDTNVFPFWTGIFDEKDMMKRAFECIQKAGLDKPFPLKYANKHYKSQRMFFYEILARGYERDTIWPHTGLIYMSLLKFIDKQKYNQYLEKYKQVIEKYKTFLEVYDSIGNPYKSPFYISDEGMLWSSILLDMIQTK